MVKLNFIIHIVLPQLVFYWALPQELCKNNKNKKKTEKECTLYLDCICNICFTDFKTKYIYIAIKCTDKL